MICEEYACTPSVAEAELAADEARDEPILFDIIALRRLKAAKIEFEAASRAGETIPNPSPALVDLMQLEHRLMVERHAPTE